MIVTCTAVPSQVDCTTCANCCRTMGMTVDSEDVARLAGRLGLSMDEFEVRYVSIEHGEKLITQTPCPFLNGYLCSVYEDRPKDCREFPYLDKEDIRSRPIGLIKNAADCPIVFNTLETLKRRLGR